MNAALPSEAELKALLDAGDTDECLKQVLRGYGPEILGFLRARPGPAVVADDAFALFAEDVWKGLPQWEPRGTLRAWLYTLARNAWNRAARQQGRRERIEPPLGSAVLARAVADARSRTQPHQQTSVKDQFRALREQLSEPDQTLLVLRVDRGLDWLEIAQVLGEAFEGDGENGAARAAARLRQRFRVLRDRLTRMARDAGLLES